MKSSSFQAGSKSFRYQQVHQNIPVFAGQMIANYDAGGRLAALIGEISPSLSVSTTPTLPITKAADAALAYVAKDANVQTGDLSVTTPALWIYDPRLLTSSTFPARLAWRMEVKSVSHRLPIRYLVLVDASFDGILLAYNQVDTAWHASASVNKPTDVNVKPTEKPIALNAPLLNIAAPLFLPNFSNPPGATYNSHNTSDLQDTPGTTSILVCSTPPTALKGAGSCDGTATATTANAAHYFAYNTFNYYDLHHNRNSIDGAGMALISNVNYTDSPPYTLANAFWDGTQMVYGNAGFFTADDVIGHELTHGVTENSSGLIYAFEAGAINESMSDIFGEFVDQWNGINSFGAPDSAAAKWQLGEDLSIGAIRNMANPPAFNQPDRTQSPLYYKEFGDYGGVHTNSGIGNKAAYLMAAGGSFNGFVISPLGNDKTSAIFYEVNTNLLPPGADYTILGAALIQACSNIRAGANPLGISASDCTQVDNVTRATEMQIKPGTNVAKSVDLCPAGNIPDTYLFNDDLEAGMGNFTSGKLVDIGSMPASLAWQDAVDAFGTSYAVSGQHSLFGANRPALYGYSSGNSYESFLEMNADVAVPNTSTYYLHFKHSFGFELDSGGRNYDGGVLEYSLNGGISWIDVAALYDAGQNYVGTINNLYGNPLGGRKGFVQGSHGYVSTRYKLSSLAGQNIRFRWLIGADPGYNIGWFLDDIQVYNCISASAAPDRNFISDTTPTLTWSKISWATRYEVQVAANSAFTGAASYFDDTPQDPTFTIPAPLDVGVTYYWRVRAYNGTTVGGWSVTEHFTVAP
jgi:Zn-dependent metalloprotease